MRCAACCRLPRPARRRARPAAARWRSARPAGARADDAFVVQATSRAASGLCPDRRSPRSTRKPRRARRPHRRPRTGAPRSRPAEPMAVDIEQRRADLLPAALLAGGRRAGAALAAAPSSGINRYLATGGTILFDTREQASRRHGRSAAPRLGAAAAPARRRAQDPAAGAGAARSRADQILLSDAGISRPLDRRHSCGSSRSRTSVNDGVASVIVGGNDWAGAWAVDGQRPAALSPWCPAASRSARWPIASASTS